MELLIAINSQGTSPVSTLDCQLFKAGDVIHYHADGADWGKSEINNSNWRIVRVPNLSTAQADSLIALELPTDPHNPSPTLQKRGMTINLQGLDLLSPGYVLGIFKSPNVQITQKSIASYIATLPAFDPAAFFALASLKPLYVSSTPAEQGV